MGVPPKTRLPAEDASANLKLNSWKEIAAYLGRDPRTLQLWEKEQGFPVHRLNHRARASVYAYPAEVDAWLLERSGKKTPPAGAEAAQGREFRRPQWLRMGIYAAAALMFATLLVTAALMHRGAASQLPVQSGALLVLPFEEQVATDDSLTSGLTEKVVADLRKTAMVRVIAAEPGVGKDSQLSGPAAKQLHVDFILEGTVAEVGGEVQATVELVTAPERAHVWGATYKRSNGNVRTRAEEIGTAIAADLTRKIASIASADRPPQTSEERRARHLYLTGRFYWNRRDRENLRKAIAFYKQALALDPHSAAAYAGLAEAYDLMTDQGVMTEVEAFRSAKAAAQTALAIDANCAEAHNALAFAIYRQDWDFRRAEEEFRKATALDPDSAVAHQWFGEFLGDLMRFEESIAELRIARDLDPLSPMVGSDLADGYMHAGRLDQADAELKRVLDLYPDFLPAHGYRITVALARNDYAAAQSEAEFYFRSAAGRGALDEVEIRRLAATGKLLEARALLRRVFAVRGAGMRPYERARLEFAAGESEQGYASLERAYREHSWWLVTMMVDPAFATVRGQPRFLAMARRVGLPANEKPPALAMHRNE